MITRKLTLFLLILLAWMTGVALLGALSMPKALLPYAFAHAPRFVYQVFFLWFVCPAVVVLVLLGNGPFRPFFNRLIHRGRELPPDRKTWSARTMVVTSLFTAFGQTWQTLALVLLWHKRQLPWVAQAMHGPHFWGIPDPHHLIPRLWPAAGGLLVAWFGNGFPKLLSPFRGGREPYDWGKMMRACGWAMTLGGLAAAAWAMLVPDWRAAWPVSGAILMTSLIACIPIWAIYRFTGGHHSGIAPPEGL